MMILIFKTNLLNNKDVNLVAEELTALAGAGNWTVDITDEDKVLRLQVKRDITETLKHLLANHGFTCEILK